MPLTKKDVARTKAVLNILGAAAGLLLGAAASIIIGYVATTNESSCDGGLCGIWLFVGLAAAIPAGLVGALIGWGVAALIQRGTKPPSAPVPSPSSHWHD